MYILLNLYFVRLIWISDLIERNSKGNNLFTAGGYNLSYVRSEGKTESFCGRKIVWFIKSWKQFYCNVNLFF
ncbi:MAG: hypothetical protein ACTS4Y_00695 [Candidatus Hodgkinia cicadicola]